MRTVLVVIRVIWFVGVPPTFSTSWEARPQGTGCRPRSPSNLKEACRT